MHVVSIVYARLVDILGAWQCCVCWGVCCALVVLVTNDVGVIHIESSGLGLGHPCRESHLSRLVSSMVESPAAHLCACIL